MRFIWIILLLLVAIGAAALWNQLHAGDNPDAALLREAADAVADTTTPPASTEPANRDTAAKASSAPEASGASALVDDLLAGRAERAADPATDAAAPTVSARGAAPAPPPPSESLTLGRDAKIAGATVVPGSIVRLPDGALRADDRFTIRGAGTQQDPYRISWELLGSAADTFQPRLGETRLPQRVAMLDDTWVRIEGYAAFPVYSFDPTELLMMLNQWDGCCIGVPPTPFDAIEAKLASAPRERKRQVTYFGAVEGKLSIEPYLVESWLVGLYVMSDARFTLDM